MADDAKKTIPKSLMELEIVCSHCRVFKGLVSYVELETMTGRLGILPGHAPLITIIKTGTITCRTPEGEIFFDVDQGMLKCEENQLKIFTGDARQCLIEDEEDKENKAE